MILAADTTLNPMDPLAIGLLLAALGLSSTAGLRAYLPLLAVGLAGAGDTPLVPLQSGFKDLSSPPVLVILTLLVLMEFTVDKIPVVDHLSDVIHTVIRPVAGAIIMAGTQNSLSDVNGWVAAASGALLALVFHGAKATARPVVTASTIGHGNPVVSFVEDALVVLAVLVLTLLPFVGFILFLVVAFLVWRGMRGIVRWLTGRRKRARGAPAAGTVASVPPIMQTPLAMPGAPPTAPVAYPTGPYAPTAPATGVPAAQPFFPTQTSNPPHWPVGPDTPTQPGNLP